MAGVLKALLGIGGRQVSLMIAAGLVGAYAGWELVTRTPSATLRVVFAIALVLIGVAIIARAEKASKAGQAPDWVI